MYWDGLIVVGTYEKAKSRKQKAKSGRSIKDLTVVFSLCTLLPLTTHFALYFLLSTFFFSEKL
jgi:hypothetical protein